MRVDERLINLTPGMAVTVEIKTGSQRIIATCSRPSFGMGTTACASGNAGGGTVNLGRGLAGKAETGR